MKKTLIFALLTTVIAAGVFAQADNFTDAKKAIMNGKYAEGLPYFRGEFSKNPKDWQSAYYLSIAYCGLGQYDDMMAPCEAVIKYSDNKTCVAYTYTRIGLYNEHVKQNYNKALKAYNAAVDSDPNYGYSYFLRGALYYEMAIEEMEEKNVLDSNNVRLKLSKVGNSKLKNAIKDLQQSIKIDPIYPAYIRLALIHFTTGNFEESERTIEKAFLLKGEIPDEAYCTLLDTYIIQEKYSEAAKLLVNLIENNDDFFWVDRYNNILGERAFATLLARYKVQQNQQPDQSIWPYYIARLYGDVKEDYGKAIDYAKQAYQTDDRATHNALLVARYMHELGNFEGALAYANRAIVLDRESSAAYAYKSSALYYLGRSDEAITAMTKAIELEPNHYWYYYRRGFYYDNLKRFDEAIEDYSVAIELNPDYAYAYLGIGDAYRLQGNRPKAEKYYQKTIEIDTVPMEASCAMFALHELRRNQEAITFLEQYISATNYSAGAYYDAACLFSRMGEYDKAMAYLKKSLSLGYSHWNHMLLDDDIDPLRERDDYKQMVADHKEIPFPKETLEGEDSESQTDSKSTQDKVRQLMPNK